MAKPEIEIGPRSISARLASPPKKPFTQARGVVSASVLLLAASFLLGSVTAFPQAASPDPPRSAAADTGVYRIAGKIVNAATGAPLRHATVAVLSEENSHTIAAVESDSDGHFSLDKLAAAKYQLTASKRGFRTAFYDEHDLYNSAVVTGPDQDTGNLVFRLVPGAVLRGVVTTDGGDPVEDARVMLFLKSHDGKPGMHIEQADSKNTDDTGAYEFSNLAAGEYMLAVIAEPWYAMHRQTPPGRGIGQNGDSVKTDPPTALDVAYPVTYFDSTTDESTATHITLAGGATQEADVILHAVPALRIEVPTPRKTDGSIARAELRQTVFGTTIGAESSGFMDSIQTGRTEFNGVAPGHYELYQGDPPRVLEMDAAASLEVDPAQGAQTVAVRGTLRTAAGAAITDDCGVTLEAVDRPDQIGAVCVRGAFTFPSVPPGRWELTASGGGTALGITAVTEGTHTLAGSTITVQDHPMSLVVTVSQGSTKVQGFAKRNGKGLAGVMIVLAPKELAAMDGLARRDQSDSDGSFALRDVAPGDYVVVAIQDGWNLDWADPSVIARYLPGGLPVTVSDKSGKLLTLSAAVPVQNP
jgi:5-hydroxyisourate hydrolase-like protein (transthyretin family)